KKKHWLAYTLAAVPLACAAAWFVVPRPAGPVPISSAPAAAVTTRTLTVEVTPREARVTVDDRRAEGNPAVAKVTPGVVHVVRAELEGYQPSERRLFLDADTAMTIALTPEAPPPDPTSSAAAPASGTAPAGKGHVPARGGGGKPAGTPGGKASCDPP